MKSLFGIPMDEKQSKLHLIGKLTFVVPGLVDGSTNEDAVKAINRKSKTPVKLYAKIGDQYLSIPIKGQVRIVKRAR